jgi:hypothetical protein
MGMRGTVIMAALDLNSGPDGHIAVDSPMVSIGAPAVATSVDIIQEATGTACRVFITSMAFRDGLSPLVIPDVSIIPLRCAITIAGTVTNIGGVIAMKAGRLPIETRTGNSVMGKTTGPMASIQNTIAGGKWIANTLTGPAANITDSPCTTMKLPVRKETVTDAAQPSPAKIRAMNAPARVGPAMEWAGLKETVAI